MAFGRARDARTRRHATFWRWSDPASGTQYVPNRGADEDGLGDAHVGSRAPFIDPHGDVDSIAYQLHRSIC